MVQVHFDRNAVTCKIVYYGPGLSGKTTNLEIIHQKAPADSRGDMVSIATRGDRTLYFDYLPLELGQVQGMETTFQLYTVPGQIYYNNTRKLVLQGVDGIVFVADSSAAKLEENRESFANLQENLQAIGLSINDVPVVLQYNKRDLPDALPINELDAQLNSRRMTTFEAVARDGQGVFVTLKEIGRQVIERINTNQASPRRRTGNSVPKEVSRQSTESPTRPLPPALPTPVGQQSTPRQNSPLGEMPTPAHGQHTPTKRLGNDAPTRMINSPPASFQSAADRQAPTEPGRGSGSSSKRTAATKSPSTGQANTRPQSNPGGQRRPPSKPTENPKERHLQKAKPPSLSQRRSHQLKDLNDLGSTEPHLKKYRTEDGGGGGSRFLRFVVGLFLAILTLAIILAVLTLFVPRVNELVVPHLPAGMQEMLEHRSNQPTPQQGAPAIPQPTVPEPTTTDSDEPAPSNGESPAAVDGD